MRLETNAQQKSMTISTILCHKQIRTFGEKKKKRTFGLNLIEVTDFWEKLKKALLSVAGKICKHTCVLHFACNGRGFEDPLRYVHVRLRGLLVLKG